MAIWGTGTNTRTKTNKDSSKFGNWTNDQMKSKLDVHMFWDGCLKPRGFLMHCLYGQALLAMCIELA